MNRESIQLKQRQKATPSSISIVIPCFNEDEILPELYKRCSKVINEINVDYEFIFVDDGSSDRTWPMLCNLQSQDKNLKIIKLSRNFGHQLALTAGLDQSNGELVLILDADLQDPPELAKEMIEKWKMGYDVVYGKRISREGESRSKKFFAFAFYRVINSLIKTKIPQDSGDFRLMDRKAVDALLKLRENSRFIRGMVSWIGFSQTYIEYDRPQRFAGKTKYPFRKSLVLAIDAITSFSTVPLKFASYIGVGISFLAFTYIIVVIILKFLGINFPGYTSIMATMLLLGGAQLIVLGVIGEYLGRIYEQSKNRPLYFINEIKGEPLKNLPEMINGTRQ